MRASVALLLATLALVVLASVASAAPAAGYPVGSECAALGATDPVTGYRDLAALPASDLAALGGRTFTLQLDDPVADRWEVEPLPNGHVQLMYRMGRNDVTEGWNWHPEADRATEDYYRYKYLPLGQRETEVAPARIEPDPAVGGFTVHYLRRDAYYFAFDNPYAFYVRNDEDLGFAAEVDSAPTDGHFQIVARGHFTAPWRSESSTYWRAIPAQPNDTWLKNRYFMGQLETLWFCASDGHVLAKLGK
jgi:hypothetical protein